MKSYLPFIVVGLSTGSIYALAAMGLVVTYKTSGIFNFAHGAQAALGAYVMYELWERQGWPWPLAALAALLVAGVCAGLVLEGVAQGLAPASVAARVGAMVGLLVGIQGLLHAVFGAEALPMRYFLSPRVFRMGGVNVRFEQVFVTAFVLVAGAGLWLFLSRTRLGAATQAVVDDPNLLALQGISPSRVRRAAWLIGSCFAAVSGILLAPNTGLDAGILTLLVFYAFGAAAVGAFSSLPLTYAGGIALGLGISLLTKFITTSRGPITALPTTLPFLVLFVALLVAPKARLVQRGGATLRRELAPFRLDRTSRLVGGTAAALVLLLLPHVVDTRVSLYLNGLGFVTLFASLSLLVRTSGQISLCHMSFAAFGAVTLARATEAGIPWPIALVLGGVLAVPLGALVAVPAIRLSGVYLAIATFGFGLLVQYLVFPSSLFFSDFTKVLDAPRPELGLFDAGTDTGYYYVLLGVTASCCAIVLAVQRSRLGRLLQGLRDAPIALDAHGANSNLSRLWVFCISAFLAGVGGAALAPVTQSVSAPPFSFSISLLLVSVLFMAGRQPVLGPVIAAVLYAVVPGYVQSEVIREYLPVMFGLGAVIGAIVGGMPVVSRIEAAKRTRQRLARSVVRARVAPATEVTV